MAFLQVAVILTVCQLLAAVAWRVHQPAVVAQLIAGVLVGPSVLGALAPAWQRALFPASTMTVISTLGQVGLALFMFTIGIGLDLGRVRGLARAGLTVSVLGTGVPLLAGALLALPISHDPRFFPPTTPAPVATLFVAVSLAVTAFPVMARILADCGLLGSPIASMALACGCFSDAVAWCLLAIVLAGVAGTPGSAVLTLGGAVALSAAVLLGARPLLARLAASKVGFGPGSGPRGGVDEHGPLGGVDGRWAAAVLVALMLVAWVSQLIGISPAFGAFILGVAMPRHPSTAALGQRLAPVASDLLLPLFFAAAGLSTRLGLVAQPGAALLMVVTIVVATLAKGGSCVLAARMSGLGARDAVGTGVLMNARGLVELVVLTVGLERHVITPTLYAVLVVMTAVTTLVPSPVLMAIYRRHLTPAEQRAPHEEVMA